MLKWGLWESRKRYHEVYVEAMEVYSTYCGFSQRPSGISDESEAPSARCRYCRSTMRSAYLVPDQLRALPQTAQAVQLTGRPERPP